MQPARAKLSILRRARQRLLPQIAVLHVIGDHPVGHGAGRQEPLQLRRDGVGVLGRSRQLPGLAIEEEEIFLHRSKIPGAGEGAVARDYCLQIHGL